MMSLNLEDRELISRLVDFLISEVGTDKLSVPTVVSHIANVTAAMADNDSNTWKLYILALLQKSTNNRLLGSASSEARADDRWADPSRA